MVIFLLVWTTAMLATITVLHTIRLNRLAKQVEEVAERLREMAEQQMEINELIATIQGELLMRYGLMKTTRSTDN